MRCYPAETFDGLYSDGYLIERMTNMLRYIGTLVPRHFLILVMRYYLTTAVTFVWNNGITGYPPVCELIVMLVAMTPLQRSSPLYSICAKNRWHFIEEISKWNFVLNTTKAVVNPVIPPRPSRITHPSFFLMVYSNVH